MSFLVSKFVVSWETARSIACKAGFDKPRHGKLMEKDQAVLIRAGKDEGLQMRRTTPKSTGRYKRHMKQGEAKYKQVTSAPASRSYSPKPISDDSWRSPWATW